MSDSQKTPVFKGSTKQGQIGFVFGSPLSDFTPDKTPSELDVVCHYIYKFDETRGTSYFIKKQSKEKVKDDVTENLISVWQSLGLESRSKKDVRKRVTKIIDRAEKLIDNGSAAKNRSNEVWINGQRQDFSQIVDISLLSNLFPSSGSKRKSDELVSLV